jgi:hypothetical protein
MGDGFDYHCAQYKYKPMGLAVDSLGDTTGYDGGTGNALKLLVYRLTGITKASDSSL